MSPNKIVAWSLQVVWNDGSTEVLDEIPNHISQDIDEFLTFIEEESND